MKHKISIIGSGYVGLVTGACFAELGNLVICVDNAPEKIEKLKKGIIPFFEPGLEQLVLKNYSRKRLKFTTYIREAVKNSDIIFICVGTPPKQNGNPDLSAIKKASEEIGKTINGYKLIVEKSTVPVKTAGWIKKIIKKYAKEGFDIAVNPEFLREGSAINEFMHPDRIVIGTDSEKADKLLSEVYKSLTGQIVHTDINSAEISKCASNVMLAQKISTINKIAELCDKTGADIEKVAEIIGLDPRIGNKFLKAGLGYGGSCLPKDLDAFIYIYIYLKSMVWTLHYLKLLEMLTIICKNASSGRQKTPWES